MNSVISTFLNKIRILFSTPTKTAIFIVNYNMPERADKLAEYLRSHVKSPYDIFLIDNGSDISEPAQNTTLFLSKNVQTCRGWIAGLEAARKKDRYFAYWFLITSAEFVPGSKDPLTPMVKFFKKNSKAVGIHPALTMDSTTAWKHMITRGGRHPRETWMVDNIASLYRATWFDSIGWFDKELIYAWGIDVETCYLARKQERTIWIDERIKVKKITNIAYKMNRMNMTSSDREIKASQNMKEVLTKKYGDNYWDMMMTDYVDDYMR